MESSAETKKASDSSKRVVIIAAVLVLTVAAAAAAVVLNVLGGKEESSGGLPVGYATEAKVLLDQDSLQAAVDEAMRNAKDGNIGLYYRNDATSKNGVDFDCSIGNSSSNIYDMFLTIYADAEMTDRLFLSGLVPPGSGFENITLEHALDSGTHRVYVALTTVDSDEETGEQVIKGQVMHTMDFHVNR